MHELLIDRAGDGVTALRLNRPERRNALATPLLRRIRGRAVAIAGSDTVFAAGVGAPRWRGV